jgi:transposase InsO family protein
MQSAQFIRRSLDTIPYTLQMVQSDHGGEFAKWFTKQLLSSNIEHRHTRVRRPTDNGLVERIMRTLEQSVYTEYQEHTKHGNNRFLSLFITTILIDLT